MCTEAAIKHLSRTMLSFVALLALAACGGGGGNSTGIGPHPAPGPNVIASQVIGPNGGSVSVTDQSSPLAGTRVVIPPGALSASTLITIGYASGSTVPADVLVAFDGIENPHSTPEVPGWYVPVACLVHWCDLETPADIERYLNA